MTIAQRDGHPELVSGSVRGEGQEKARGEMLKQVHHDEMIISMRRGNVGTSACSVRVFYSRKSRQRLIAIIREIREIRVRL